MPASRKIFFLSAGALACHFVALARHSTIASNIIEFVLIVLVTAACFQAANRAAGYARRFWRLMGVAFGLYALGQAMASYYDSVLHASFEQYWPSDILFLFHVAPMALALFLGDDTAESRVYRWQSWLDFLQIGIISLSAYFFFLYFPLLLLAFESFDRRSLYTSHGLPWGVDRRGIRFAGGTGRFQAAEVSFRPDGDISFDFCRRRGLLRLR